MCRSFRHLAILCVLLLFLSGCISVEQVKVDKIQKYSIGAISKDGVELLFEIPIHNPNKFSFKVSNLFIEVFSGTDKVAYINNINKIRVNAQSDQIYSLKAKVNFVEKNLNLAGIISLFSKSKKNLKLKGFIKIKRFPFSKKIFIDNQNISNLLKL